jgi:hypothetical protein
LQALTGAPPRRNRALDSELGAREREEART